MNMENNYLNHKWTKDELVELRNQIVLNSIYYSDYSNDFGVDEHKVFDFFDGFIDGLYQEGKEKFNEGDIDDEILKETRPNRNGEITAEAYGEAYADKEMDNPYSLWNYYCDYDYNPLPITDIEMYHNHHKNYESDVHDSVRRKYRRIR